MTEPGERSSPLLERLRQEPGRELRLLAARGLLPFPPEELVEAQLALTGDPDSEVAAAAADSLEQLDPRIAVSVVEEAREPRVLSFFGRRHRHPLVQETVLRKREVPRELLVELAPRLSPELQEVLLLRQDAVVEAPEILDALESNPDLSAYASRRIAEYRQHLVRRAPTPEVPREEPPPPPEALPEEVQAAISEAESVEPDGDVDEEVTGLSEGQIRTLPLPVRLQLSRGAPRTLRGILIRDSNPQVATSVLRYNAIPDSEVEQIARSRSVLGEVLEELGGNRQWMRRYPVVLSLARNPRTPPALAMKLLPRLAVKDLRGLGMDRNVPNVVRKTAQRMYRIKTG